jgi:protein O-mannosyl-transferase
MRKNISKKSKGNYLNTRYIKYFLILFLIIISYFVFSNSFNNDFTNYDDELYVINNNYIKDFSIKGIENIFKAFTKDELPLTLLSFAINYKFSGLNPYPYHAVNIIFHLLNIVLVFQLILLITKKINIAFITSLLFGIHPFRVESVSWVTERKDVLYTFFFLLSLLCYIKYINDNYKLRYLIFSLILFILSILSKFAALTLPVLILLTDIFYNRKFTFKLLSEKIVFFIIPVISGIFHFYNKEIVQINEMLVQNFPFIDRIFMGSYALIFYLINSLFPLKLTLIHPYPVKINNFLPLEYYFSMLISISFILLIIILLKKYLNKYKLVIYGLFFFLISISIVLHIAPMGGNIVVGERYTYIAYIGLFLIMGFYFDLMIENKFLAKYKYLIYFLSAVYIFVLCNISYNRNQVWKNSITLWTDVINKNPDIYFAYNKRADKFIKINNYEDALADLTNSLKLNSGFYETYNLRGTSRAYLKDYKGALDDYNNAIRLNPKYSEAFKNRGLTKL